MNHAFQVLRRCGMVLGVLVVPLATFAQAPFGFPTSNHALFEPGGGPAFLVGTVGKPWTSGGFGCVRSDGWQMHEGLDIRCLQRDRHGEPTDPVLATADGTVVYINTRPALSNYGNYVVVKHRIQGIEIDSLYAHLHSIEPHLKVGSPVTAGQVIAIMGRTTNTRQGISKERAHVHFELNLFANDHFEAWFRKFSPNERNDHGIWNGQNLLGLDPQLILQAEHEQGSKFSLLQFLRSQTALCRVLVRSTSFPWLKRYPMLVRPDPAVEKAGIGGYDVALNYNGVPFELIPRSAAQIKSKAKFQLLSVNEAEERRNPCRRLVELRRGRWELTRHGIEALELLTE